MLLKSYNIFLTITDISGHGFTYVLSPTLIGTLILVINTEKHTLTF